MKTIPQELEMSEVPISQYSGLQALFMSFAVILVSEIGDKTFLIAAVMAMQHSRLLIFSAAISALLVMTVLSCLLGQLLPNLISKQVSELICACLFFVFGIKLFSDSFKMTGNECMEELDEVTQELVSKREKDLEGGEGDMKDAVYKIWMQTFVMTFVAEWGDRSQIATVALAGSQDFIWVTIGGLLGHALCTSIAVVGGRMLATRISVKTVNLMGAFLFISFGVFGLYQAVVFYE